MQRNRYCKFRQEPELAGTEENFRPEPELSLKTVSLHLCRKVLNGVNIDFTHLFILLIIYLFILQLIKIFAMHGTQTEKFYFAHKRILRREFCAEMQKNFCT